jgi:hypothetical protein
MGYKGNKMSVPSVDPDTTINYSDISDPVLKATIASFVQSCQTESNSIESEHVLESIIDWWELFVVINIDGRTFHRMGYKGNKMTWLPE